MAVKPGWEGRYFEDFEVGDIYRCRLGRTVTEADNIWFTLLTNNTNQIHFNNEFGKRTEFGKCLINSALTFSTTAGIWSTTTWPFFTALPRALTSWVMRRSRTGYSLSSTGSNTPSAFCNSILLC